ncbi:MAG: ATP-binding protein [Desulfosporosinus sp.]
MRKKDTAPPFEVENIFSSKRRDIWKVSAKIFKNVMILVVIMGVCTAISIYFKHIGAFESNIVMVYLLGILLFSYLAGGYLYSLFASVFGVLVYNFFFTEPYFTLQVYSSDYPITFIVMFTVGFFTSMLTIRIKRETFLAEEREERIKALYHIGRMLLEVKNGRSLAEVSAKEIAKQLRADVLVQFLDLSGNLRYRHVEGNDIFNDDKERIACHESYQSGNACGCGTVLFSEAKAYYMPVIGKTGVLGVLGISLPGLRPLDKVQKEFLDVIGSQIAVVLERERLYEKQQETQLEVQRERLRSDMLRTISHDLRTPLTGIMGLASTVLTNFESVSDEVKKVALHNIYDDADWLNELVENILNTTRFGEGKIKLNIGQEAAEEIVAEAIGHVKKRAPGYRILANIPDEIILLQVDGVLIRQVLVNLLSNAVNYSPEGSEITVSVCRKENRVVFKVSDDGPGISQNDLLHIFERFYSRHNIKNGIRRGMGLGLSLCKSIVEAHGGEITVTNHEPHGTIAYFYIPIKEGEHNATVDLDS